MTTENNTVFIEKGVLDADNVSFKESVNEKTGKKQYHISARVIPYGEISRNKCQYTKESAEATIDQVRQHLPMMVDHITSGPGTRRIGEWNEAISQPNGLYVTGKVYNIEANKDIIEFLQEATSPKVSLQIQGDATSKESNDGSSYREVTIKEWLEISVIQGVSGFANATIQNFEVAVAEAFGVGVTELEQEPTTIEDVIETEEKKELDLFSRLLEIRESYKEV